MKRHIFILTDGRADPRDICSGCGLTWLVIRDQMATEQNAAPHIITSVPNDDCDLRKRKQQLLAFI